MRRFIQLAVRTPSRLGQNVVWPQSVSVRVRVFCCFSSAQTTPRRHGPGQPSVPLARDQDTPLSIKTASSLTQAGLGPRTDASHNRQISWMRRGRGGLGEIPTPDRPDPLATPHTLQPRNPSSGSASQLWQLLDSIGEQAAYLCCETSLLAYYYYAHQSGQPGFWQLHEAYGPLGRCEAARTFGIPCFRHGPPAPEHITMGSDPQQDPPMIT